MPGIRELIIILGIIVLLFGASRLPALGDALEHAADDEQHIIALAQGQKLTLLETVVMLLCYAVESDPMVGRRSAYLQEPLGGSRPTLSLLSAMMPAHGSLSEVSGRQGSLIAPIASCSAVRLGLLEPLDGRVALAARAGAQPQLLHPFANLSPDR